MSSGCNQDTVQELARITQDLGKGQVVVLHIEDNDMPKDRREKNRDD